MHSGYPFIPIALPSPIPCQSLSQIHHLVLFCALFSLRGPLDWGCPLEHGGVTSGHTTKGNDSFSPWIYQPWELRTPEPLVLPCLAVDGPILGQIQGSPQLLRNSDCPEDAMLPGDNIHEILFSKIRIRMCSQQWTTYPTVRTLVTLSEDCHMKPIIHSCLHKLPQYSWRDMVKKDP